MRLLLLLVLTLASAGSLAAQAPFEPGYLVVRGDTLRGEIAVGDDREATRGARFRDAPGVGARTVGVEDATAFGTDGGRDYRQGLFPTAPTAFAETARRGFARVVRDGPAGLLRYEPTETSQTFYLVVDGQQTGLFVIEDVVGTPGRPRVARNEIYKPALVDRLGGCGVTEADVAALSYTEADLVTVVDAYNACRAPGYAPPTTAARPPIGRRSSAAVEVSLGVQTSSFWRRAPFGPDDPSQPAATVGVLGELQLGSLPSPLRFVMRLDYERTVLRHAVGDGNDVRTEIRRDAVLVGLGTRLAVDVAGVPSFAGAGYQSGVTLARQGQTDVPMDDLDDEGIVSKVGIESFASMGGLYVEVGARPASRVGLVARLRPALFSDASVFFPGDGALEERPFGLRTASAALTARF